MLTPESIEIVALAVLQGIGEFLPISSSGHLVVAAAVFDQLGHPLHEKLSVNIMLHVGTLLAILVFYWPRLIRLLTTQRRLLGLLLVGSVPAGVLGVAYRLWLGPMLEYQWGQDPLENPLVAGLMFPLTGLLLIGSAARSPGPTPCQQMSYFAALTIGLFQAFAILPGISRSGATIAAGLLCGLKRDEAAAFSFLLAVPAIGGAALLETLYLRASGGDAVAPALLAVGALVSFVVGCVSLWWLLRWLDQGRLQLFAWWVLLMGAAVILWQTAI